MSLAESLQTALNQRFPQAVISVQRSIDQVPTLWIEPSHIRQVLSYVKEELDAPYRMLFDLTAIDERSRQHREDQPAADYSVVYQLLSFDRNAHLRLKVPLRGENPSLPSASAVWPNANWYEREAFDLFGINFEGHPLMRRIMMPQWWKGHPLRKDHPARATEMEPFSLPEDRQDFEQNALEFKPEEWGLEKADEDGEFMFLNLGPQHPGTHGVLRIILQMQGEIIRDAVLDIGYHHRGAEKMGERQTWHSYIPYTDRVDYLGGVMNNLAYLLAVEKMAGIVVPPRAQVIRVMMCELFRIASHLVWFGTFAQDMGVMSPVFYLFTERERIFRIVEGVCGGRMHPSWFRIGGVAHDLPQGWHEEVKAFTRDFEKVLDENNTAVMKNSIFKARTKGVGHYTTREAIEWGITGAGLRATGFDWDFRKKQPYSGYENFDFEVPIATGGDCYDRGVVRIEEMRQSIRIINQCVSNMPNGDFKADHPLTTPPRKDKTLVHIETLINHFLNSTWGPSMPASEVFHVIEATKGANAYYLVSDGGPRSYRTRIRTPSFPHLQMLPLLVRGTTISDLMAVLGALDFVLADLDR